jgi:2'-5' RNA ligase
MDRIAVDVVLLPDREMSERAIAANARLVEKYDSQIVLGKDNCLPHVSLAMGCINEQDVQPIAQVLGTIAGECPIGELTVTGIAATLNAKGQQVSSFILAQTVELRSLHENVMNRMQTYFSYDVTPEMIHGNEPVADSTLAWIATFREKSSFGAFFPHLTIGYGSVTEPTVFPIRMKASKLALCHLGNHCTCRKVLTLIDY